MNTLRASSRLVNVIRLSVLLLGCIVAAGCDDALLDSEGSRSADQVESRDLAAASGFGFTSDPVPDREGPFKVCSHDYDFSPDENQYLAGRIYAPVADERRCEIEGRFNLVLIAHADGQGPILQAHTNYEQLARHLASHGLVVVSINRYGLKQVGGANSIFDQVLKVHLDHLYGNMPTAGHITDDVALIGHSAGGRSVILHAGVVNDAGRNLKALVAMAPTVDLNQGNTFEGETDAFLGLHVTLDTDVNAFGNKSPGQPMLSTFMIYDRAGIMAGSPNFLSLTKDMVFFQGGNHYFQNTSVSRAYVTAFLQQHLNGHAIFGRFLKHQERPATLTGPAAPKIWQQHADSKRLVLADFENGSTNTNTAGGSIVVTGSLKNVDVDHAYILDGFSPHLTQAMKFDWKKSVPNPGRIALNFASPTNLQGYRYVSLRITQVYDPESNPDGVDRDFSIVLHTQNGDDGVSVDEPLHFPEIVAAPAGALQAEQTKNAMRSYLVRLSSFEGVDLSTVTGVTIDFSTTGNGQTTFLLDDVEFYE